MRPSDKILYQHYDLGLDAQEFLNSRLGQALQREAQGQIDAAMDVLLDIDADIEAIKQAQHKAIMAKTAMVWLLEFVGRGELAAETAKELDAEEMR